MSALKQEAVRLIEDIQEEQMGQVIAFLKNIEIRNKGKKQERALNGFDTLMEFAGTLPEDFDYGKELAEAREEKYGSSD